MPRSFHRGRKGVNDFSDAYRKAVEANPESPEPYRRWGEALVESGDLEAAEEVLTAAVAKFPEDPELLHGLAVTLAY